MSTVYELQSITIATALSLLSAESKNINQVDDVYINDKIDVITEFQSHFMYVVRFAHLDM